MVSMLLMTEGVMREAWLMLLGGVRCCRFDIKGIFVRPGRKCCEWTLSKSREQARLSRSRLMGSCPSYSAAFSLWTGGVRARPALALATQALCLLTCR